jgi:signal peptidase I
MSTLTGLLYGSLLVYLGGWYMEFWKGNFSLLLFVLTLVTFGYWLAERLRFAPRRARAAAELERQGAARREQLAKQGITQVDGDLAPAREAVLQQPWWLDWTAGLFPVILVAFLLRSFLFEPFRIPSESMVPTLMVNDLILVNKFHYGIRLPVINKKIVSLNEPQRGDVMVFRFPGDPTMDYIKRVVGIPGDEITYRDQRLYVNGQAVEVQPLDDFYDETKMMAIKQFNEKLGPTPHRLLVDPGRRVLFQAKRNFPFNENCRYSSLESEVTCKVPPGHYFMMGDNRDYSDDSRFWGFVHDENIVGKAFFVWMNFGDLKRIGPFN